MQQSPNSSGGLMERWHVSYCEGNYMVGCFTSQPLRWTRKNQYMLSKILRYLANLLPMRQPPSDPERRDACWYLIHDRTHSLNDPLPWGPIYVQWQHFYSAWTYIRVLFVHKPSLPRYSFELWAHDGTRPPRILRRLLLRVTNFHHEVRTVFIITQFPNTSCHIFISVIYVWMMHAAW